jgi:hypothetical protein
MLGCLLHTGTVPSQIYDLNDKDPDVGTKTGSRIFARKLSEFNTGSGTFWAHLKKKYMLYKVVQNLRQDSDNIKVEYGKNLLSIIRKLRIPVIE